MAQEEADTALDLSPEIEPLRELFLTLAGPYEKEGGWLVLADARRDDPTKEILETAHNGTVSAETGRLPASGVGTAHGTPRPLAHQGRTGEGRRRESSCCGEPPSRTGPYSPWPNWAAPPPRRKSWPAWERREAGTA